MVHCLQGFWLVKELHSWFESNYRPFPWREKRTPYKVWVSEVMLQQTRASVVVPYFLKWMERFPDVSSLAAASVEEVIKMWEGLGYYSRARNLHTGARQITAQFNGEIPRDRAALETIRGLGPYTIGAILSFGFQQRAAAVDGNVARVLARYFAIEENICRTKTRRAIQEKAAHILDPREPWVTAEALIELGATVCLPATPRCSECPLTHNCLGRIRGIAASLPIKDGEKQTTLLLRTVAIVESRGQFLVRKGQAGKVMADLYEFPYLEGEIKGLETFKSWLGFAVEYVRQLPEVCHTFTRFKARLFPVILKAPHLYLLEGAEWVCRERLADLPFSAGHRKIARHL